MRTTTVTCDRCGKTFHEHTTLTRIEALCRAGLKADICEECLEEYRKMFDSFINASSSETRVSDIITAGLKKASDDVQSPKAWKPPVRSKLVIKGRRLYLDGIRLRGVASYALGAKLNGSRAPIELTVTLLVDSEVSINEPSDHLSGDLKQENLEPKSDTLNHQDPVSPDRVAVLEAEMEKRVNEIKQLAAGCELFFKETVKLNKALITSGLGIVLPDPYEIQSESEDEEHQL